MSDRAAVLVLVPVARWPSFSRLVVLVEFQDFALSRLLVSVLGGDAGEGG